MSGLPTRAPSSSGPRAVGNSNGSGNTSNRSPAAGNWSVVRGLRRSRSRLVQMGLDVPVSVDIVAIRRRPGSETERHPIHGLRQGVVEAHVGTVCSPAPLETRIDPVGRGHCRRHVVVVGRKQRGAERQGLRCLGSLAPPNRPRYGRRTDSGGGESDPIACADTSDGTSAAANRQTIGR